MDIHNITSIKSLIINRKILKAPIFMLLAKKSEIFHKQKGYFLFFRISCFELIYFVALTNRKLLLPL